MASSNDVSYSSTSNAAHFAHLVTFTFLRVSPFTYAAGDISGEPFLNSPFFGLYPGCSDKSYNNFSNFSRELNDIDL